MLWSKMTKNYLWFCTISRALFTLFMWHFVQTVRCLSSIEAQESIWIISNHAGEQDHHVLVELIAWVLMLLKHKLNTKTFCTFHFHANCCADNIMLNIFWSIFTSGLRILDIIWHVITIWNKLDCIIFCWTVSHWFQVKHSKWKADGIVFLYVCIHLLCSLSLL